MSRFTKNDGVQSWAVECRNLWYETSGIERLCLLRSLNLSVPKGVIYGLAGPSGCGKTTLQRCIWGYLKPSSGSIQTLGKDPRIERKALSQVIGYMPQTISLDGGLTVRETFIFWGKSSGLPDSTLKQKIKELRHLLDIETLDIRVWNLSTGTKRRVSFVCTLLDDPQLLLLDEPTVGSDPILCDAMWQHMEYLRKEKGMTIMVSSHYIEELVRTDLIGIMKQGSIINQDNPRHLMDRYQFKTLEAVVARLWLDDTHSKFILDNSIKSNQANPEPKRSSNYDNSSEYQSIKIGILFYRLFHVYKIPLLLVLMVAVGSPVCTLFFAYNALGGAPRDLPMGFINPGNDSSAQLYLQSLPAEYFILISISSPMEGLGMIENRSIKGYFQFQEEFSQKLDKLIADNFQSDHVSPRDRQIIELVFDETQRPVHDFVENIANEKIEDLLSNKAKVLFNQPEMMKVMRWKALYGEKSPYKSKSQRENVYSSLAGLAFFAGPLFFSQTFMLHQRTELLERFIAKGHSPRVIHSIGLIFITAYNFFSSFIVITLISLLIPVRLSHAAVILLFFSTLLGSLFGAIFAHLCPNETASLCIFMAYLWSIFIAGGILWPKESLPYFADILRHTSPVSVIGESIRFSLTRDQASISGSMLNSIVYCCSQVFACLIAFLYILWAKNTS